MSVVPPSLEEWQWPTFETLWRAKMSRNTMSEAEERLYADWILELTQQARYEKKKHANEHWHQVAERLAHAFGAGNPDSAGAASARGAHLGAVSSPRVARGRA